MPNAAVTRRLAAIVIADVAGYSRLMERDDTGTFARLRSIRDEVVDPAIVSHDGRIVKTAGDGFLAEFPSALAALRASVQIQREMAKRNEGVAAEDRIDYRIGLNLGDVMAEKDDIAGDGVNVASRLEALAEPGAICVSGSVREQVHGQLAVTFEDIGEQRVKNIERPIRAFRVGIDSKGMGSAWALGGLFGRRSRPARRTAIVVMVGIVLAVSAATIAWWAQFRRPAAAASAPPRSIALLPMRVSGGDGTVDAANLTRQVISAFAGGRRSARIAAYPLVAAYADGTLDPRAVARTLDVRYVAEGEIRVGTADVSVTTRLYDGSNATQLSSETSRVEASDPNLRDGAIIGRAVAQIRSALNAAERARARTAPGDSPLELLDRAGAVWQADNYSLAATAEALRLVDQALKRDPDNVAALVRRYWLLNTLYEDDLRADRDRIVAEMDAATSRAVAIDPRDPEAWHARSIAYSWQGRFAEAEEALAEARRLDPASSIYVEQQTHIFYVSGRFAEAGPIVDGLIRREGESADDRYSRDKCWILFATARHAEAVPYCERAAVRGGNWWWDETQLAAAYGLAGRGDKAREAAGRLAKLQPGITIDLLRKHRYSSHPDYRRFEEEVLFPSLRMAGIPEG